MLSSLAAQETYAAETKFFFLPEVKNTFVSWTQILRSKHVSQFSHDENNVD